MDISLDQDQQMLHDTAVSFAASAMTPARIRELEETDQGYDASVWRQIAEMGWAGALFPEQYGGAEASAVEMALVVEALGQGAIPSPLFSTVIEAGMLLLEAGTEPQRKTWLPRIAAGDAILTTAIMEASGGLKPDEIRTRITPSGNRFTITGTKLFVRDAATAESIIVAGRTGEDAADLTLLMVPRNAPGLRLQKMRAAGGESLWEARLDNVTADADAIVGDTGSAWIHIARLQMRGAAFKSAELVGIGQASLDLTVSYAKTREQFGGPIGRFQGVHHHCAEVYRDIQVSRLLAWQAAAALGKGLAGSREVSMAKAKCSDVMPAATRIAHQIHGAVAYYRDYPLELYYHRAIAAQAAYGDAGHHRRVLSHLLNTDIDAFRGEDRHELPVHYV
jgi:alkylation response protein AidB-like acyl-CoA dehydrogenase